MNQPSEHFRYSSAREKLIEHLFVGELLKTLWLRGDYEAEVLSTEVDAGGYDVVVELGGVLRHIQLKSSFRGSRTSRQNVHMSLAEKPSGCVIWIQFGARSLELGPFLWFGDKAGQPLPDIARFPVAKHTKANAQGVKTERPRLRVVPRHHFERLESIDDVVERLFAG